MSEREFDVDADFEARFRQDLRRVEAPEGFADQVMGRVDQERSGRLVMLPRRWVSLAVAAMLLIGALLGGWQWRQQKLRRERQEAEAAHIQFEAAMQVTGRTLIEVQERIGRAGETHSAGRKREVER